MSTSGILELAQRILSQTTILDQHIHDNALAQPSFESDGPVEPFLKAAEPVRQAKNVVIEAAIELRQLLEGPVKLLLPEASFGHLRATLHR
jgi:hypothetical protein